MTVRADPESAARQARILLEAGTYVGTLVRERGRVENAIAVIAPEGGIQSWLAPVVVGDVLAGFFRANPELNDWSWVGFQRHDDALTGCPESTTWLDTADIQQRATTLARPDETAEHPVMSYDRIPQRLAWAVRLVSEQGTARTVFVAGPAVWPAVEDAADSYGGP